MTLTEKYRLWGIEHSAQTLSANEWLWMPLRKYNVPPLCWLFKTCRKVRCPVVVPCPHIFIETVVKQVNRAISMRSSFSFYLPPRLQRPPRLIFFIPGNGSTHLTDSNSKRGRKVGPNEVSFDDRFPWSRVHRIEPVHGRKCFTTLRCRRQLVQVQRALDKILPHEIFILR